ncbi:MAG: radical SAM protein [Deltaproteobacteria bacterium]|nr:radical SAM protein [Deltaproteobacteria bacterium]
MSFETARSAIDWVANGLLEKKQPRMTINFGGGEPLMNWRVIEKVLEYTRQQIQPKLDVHLSLNTNSSLTTPDIAKTLKIFDVQIIASLDGSEAGNDAVRRTRCDRPTFGLIRKGFANLAAAGIPVRALHVNLTSKNFDHLDHRFIQFLNREKIISITLEPDLTDRLKEPVSSLVKKIMSLKRTAREKGITVTGYWERPFARIIGSETDTTAHFCRSVSGQTIDVLPDGSLYSCSYTDLKLGELDQFVKKGTPSHLIRSSLFKAVLDSRRIGNIEWCRGCGLEGVCGGGCYATIAHALKEKNQTIIEYRCDFYREITRHLLLDAMDQSLLDKRANQSRVTLKDNAGVK